MKCKKHMLSEIPCQTCMLADYLYFQKINDEAIKMGSNPPNDLTHLEEQLRKMHLIP